MKLSAEKTWAAELISPKSLDSKALDQLNDDMVDLSWRVCRGPDPTYWSEALEGWKTYFEEDGGYAQDYDCLAVARYGNILIHYSGYSVLPLGEDATLIWGHVGLTDPEHQGAGVLAAARDLLVEDFFARMGDFTSPTYVTSRTPNPVAYEAMRQVAIANELWDRTFFPKIDEKGQIDSTDADARRLAEEIASVLSPSCQFLSDISVVKNYIGKYGAIYRVPFQESDNPSTNDFFRRNLSSDPENLDSVLMYFQAC